MLEKKRLHRFIKPQLLDFQNFQPGKLLRLWPKSQPQPLATRLQHVLLAFSRSKWSMKIQCGNECIMLFKWNGATWDLFEFFRGYFQTCISWNNHRKVFLEKSCFKNMVRKREKWGKLIMRKISKSFCKVDH